MKQTIHAAVLDIDGTITPNHSSWLAMTRDLGASVEEHSALFEAFKTGTLSYNDSRTQLIALWQATGNATKEKLLEIFTGWPIYDEAYTLLEKLRQKNIPVILLTGATSLYAGYVAAKLSVSDYFANAELIFDSNGLLVDFTYPPDETQKKLELLQSYCTNHTIDITNVVCIGDSGNDVAIFTATGKGVMVGNGPETLRAVAWKNVDSIAEVILLLDL